LDHQYVGIAPESRQPETIHNEKAGWETGPDSLRNQAITRFDRLVNECNGDVSPTDSAGKIFSLTAILSEYLEGPKAQENFERNAFIASSALLRARTVDSHMAHPHHDSPRKLGAFRVP
jgi:hypothetical protein